MRHRKHEDVTFTESQGIPANEHAKQLAKEKSKKKEVKYDYVFSQFGSKILKVTVKPHGIYKEYVGNLSKKKEAPMLKDEIAKWKAEGLWVEPYALKAFAESKQEQMKLK